jgi:hypothetical protein
VGANVEISGAVVIGSNAVVARRASALFIAVGLCLLAASGGLRPIDARAATTIVTAYTTGYTWFDNSPPGNDICCGVIHSKAGGTGTYADPISLAVGLLPSGGGGLDYPRGTLFYQPDVRRYFIVEDSCGNVGSGGCHFLDSAPPGATTWVDRWVGGTASDSQAAVQNCANFLTDDGGGLHTLIENPPAGLAVVSGPLFQNGQCTATYGNGTAPPPPPPPPTQPPAPPPTQPPAPPPTQPPAPQPTATPATHTPTPASKSLPPVAAAPTAGSPGHSATGGGSVAPAGKPAPAPANGSTTPSNHPSRPTVPWTAMVNPLVAAVRDLLPTAGLALLLTVGACVAWVLWRRLVPRARTRD